MNEERKYLESPALSEAWESTKQENLVEDQIGVVWLVREEESKVAAEVADPVSDSAPCGGEIAGEEDWLFWCTARVINGRVAGNAKPAGT